MLMFVCARLFICAREAWERGTYYSFILSSPEDQQDSGASFALHQGKLQGSSLAAYRPQRLAPRRLSLGGGFCC